MAVRVPRTPSTKRSLAFRVNAPSGSGCTPRSAQMRGKVASISGRARARTMKLLVLRLRRAASTNCTLGRSPHCRSSSSKTTGCAEHSAARKSSHARLVWSAMRTAFWRAARSCTLTSSAKGTRSISARNSATRARSSGGTWRATRASMARRASSSRALDAAGTPMARRSAWPSTASGDPALIASACAYQTCVPPKSAPTRRTNSCRRRLLPMPGEPVTRTTRATSSETHSSRIPESRTSSLSRPTNGVVLPRSVRDGSPRSRSPRRSAYPAPAASSKPPRDCSSAAVRSSMRTPSSACARSRRTSAAARSIASPTGRFDDSSTRPVASATETVGAAERTARAHRAARRACESTVPFHSPRKTAEPSTSPSTRAPRGSTAPCSRPRIPRRGRPSPSVAPSVPEQTMPTQTNRCSPVVRACRCVLGGAVPAETRSTMPASASSTAAALGGRPSLSLASIAATSPSSGADSSGLVACKRGASASRTFASSAIGLLPVNAG